MSGRSSLHGKRRNFRWVYIRENNYLLRMLTVRVENFTQVQERILVAGMERFFFGVCVSF